MKKLSKKIYFTLVSIFTLSIITVIIAFNVQGYIDKKKSVENTINMATNNEKNTKDETFFKEELPKEIKEKDKTNRLLDENDKFLDSTVYTILLDESDNIKDIINHSNNVVDDEQITSVAKDILSLKNIKKEYIGSLFFSKYAYAYFEGSSIIIVDISNIRKELALAVRTSLVIFTFLEILVAYISKLITTWIIKPVSDSFEKQKQFVADASHELKTPLSVIIASSEALDENPGEKKWLNNIKNEADRMNKLITELLELASSENINQNNTAVGDLSKTIELAVLTFEGRAYESNVELKYDIEEGIKFKFNENKIKQLIEILLDNAIKHSKKSETINITLKQNMTNIELSVENKGDSIPKGEEEKIFERFYRIDKSRNRNENRYGLGLAIAKNIVQAHGGKITAKSYNGTTIFKVILKK